VKLIVIMIDGLSAGTFARYRARLPHLSALAARGLVVERLSPDLPATSLPGRTSIVTGVEASAHGIYGNVIWDGERFRYANPDDVRVDTLPRRAMAAGLDVAVIGYGMIRPEDASVFHHAWWANEMLQRARDLSPIPADESWLRTSRHRDASGRLAALADRGLPAEVPDAYAGDRAHYFLSELTGDQTMLQWSAGLALGEQPPDLIVTEILTPDTVQHLAGFESPFALWSLGYADALLGTLVSQLQDAGRLGDYALAIVSDHGHGPVERALYADVLLPDHPLSCEGGFLYVAVESEREAERLGERLEPHGVERLLSDHLPAEVRREVATFVAPPRCSFERRPEGVEDVSGVPRYPSNHGFRPGSAADERVAVLCVPGEEPRRVARADSLQLAPTLAAVLGLPLSPYPAAPLL
jgi:predicted AlkP superfamily pyrophosphatase or phosphodiesterase